MTVLTCQASNTNLTVPASQTIAIDLNLKPKEVRILTPVYNMSAGERLELVCQSSGSRPPAKIQWWKGGALMEHIGESTSDDGSVTTNFLAFVPSVDDNGKALSCSATNPTFPAFKLEDGWKINVLYAPLLSLILGASIQHQEILEGSDVYFECNIQANPAISELVWLFNDQPLNSESSPGVQVRNNSLLIRSVSKVHRGKFQCQAANAEGRGESEVANPAISELVWLFNDQPLNSESSPGVQVRNNSLLIRSVSKVHRGKFQCQAANAEGRGESEVVNLKIHLPASKVIIFDGSGNRISDIAGPFNEDSSVNLTCDSDGGNPPPVVKWWRGSTIADESYYTTPKGFIRNVIQLPRLSRDDLMTVLTCQASNTNLTVPASQTIAIDLNLKPKEVRILTPVYNMSAGERLELVCQSSGSRPPAKIQWWKGGALMEHIGESTSDDGSVTTNFLAFVPSVDDNGKALSCSATNPTFPAFKLEDGWKINVLYAPLLSLILGASIQHQEILEGSDVYFECNIQ
ncbi:unnamed protein product, partial [Medioppia subpectinata]